MVKACLLGKTGRLRRFGRRQDATQARGQHQFAGASVARVSPRLYRRSRGASVPLHRLDRGIGVEPGGAPP